jgi:hypothetical protein
VVLGIFLESHTLEGQAQLFRVAETIETLGISGILRKLARNCILVTITLAYYAEAPPRNSSPLRSWSLFVGFVLRMDMSLCLPIDAGDWADEAL